MDNVTKKKFHTYNLTVATCGQLNYKTTQNFGLHSSKIVKF